jgi:2-C-methyl-D-erythritol 4-phosphate cytidylyltransferase
VGTSLIIPAAGSGSRFGAPIPKQLHLLCGRAIFLHSLDRFANLVDEVVIAVSSDVRGRIEELIKQSALRVAIKLVEGGATRMDSVNAALRETAATNDMILVHDAVRPLVPTSLIKSCLARLSSATAVVAAVPCSDTVKRARSDNVTLVEQTVPRTGLWLAQTPQGFRREAGLAAFSQAVAQRWQCSDDAQVLERAGHQVALVPGDTRNIKITTQEDLELAEALIGLSETPEAQKSDCR